MSINWSIGHIITGGRDASRYDESVFGSARTKRWHDRVEKRISVRVPSFERQRSWKRLSRGRTGRFQLYLYREILRDVISEIAESHTWSRASRRASSDAVAWTAVVERLEIMLGFGRSRSRGLDEAVEVLEAEIALAVLEPL